MAGLGGGGFPPPNHYGAGVQLPHGAIELQSDDSDDDGFENEAALNGHLPPAAHAPQAVRDEAERAERERSATATLKHYKKNETKKDDTKRAARLINKACTLVDRRFAVQLYDRPADFFAADKGETDTVRVCAMTDCIMNTSIEYGPRYEGCARPATFHLQRLTRCEPKLPQLTDAALGLHAKGGAAGSSSSSSKAAQDLFESYTLFLEVLNVLIEASSVDLRGLRASAITCRIARSLVASHLYGTDVSVDAKCDASWDNAAFIARLPNLLKLRIRNEDFLPVIDVKSVQSKPRLRLAAADGQSRCGPGAALFLGAILGGGSHTLRLTDNISYLNLNEIRTRREFTLPAATHPADVLVAVGALARHAELKPEVTSPNQLRRHRKSPVTGVNVAVEARTFKLLAAAEDGAKLLFQPAWNAKREFGWTK